MSNSDFFYVSSQCLLVFSDHWGEEEPNLSIVRVTSYVNDSFIGKNTKCDEKYDPPPLTLRRQISALQLGGRECNI